MLGYWRGRGAEPSEGVTCRQGEPYMFRLTVLSIITLIVYLVLELLLKRGKESGLILLFVIFRAAHAYINSRAIMATPLKLGVPCLASNPTPSHDSRGHHVARPARLVLIQPPLKRHHHPPPRTSSWCTGYGNPLRA